MNYKSINLERVKNDGFENLKLTECKEIEKYVIDSTGNILNGCYYKKHYNFLCFYMFLEDLSLETFRKPIKYICPIHNEIKFPFMNWRNNTFGNMLGQSKDRILEELFRVIDGNKPLGVVDIYSDIRNQKPEDIQNDEIKIRETAKQVGLEFDESYFYFKRMSKNVKRLICSMPGTLEDLYDIKTIIELYADLMSKTSKISYSRLLNNLRSDLDSIKGIPLIKLYKLRCTDSWFHSFSIMNSLVISGLLLGYTYQSTFYIINRNVLRMKANLNT